MTKSAIQKIQADIKKLKCDYRNIDHVANRPSGIPEDWILVMDGAGEAQWVEPPFILKPDNITPGWIAQVDATGDEIEWVPPVLSSQNAQISLTGGQSVYTLPSVPANPASSILVYENHALMYGIGYTISGTQLTFLTNVDWQIEAGEKMHIVYS